VPKISISVGLNIPITKEQDGRFDRFTPAITIADIDTDVDLEKQIAASLTVADEAWKAAVDFIETKVSEELERSVTLGG